MPRPVWKGHISFGLVNVPVNLYPAEQRTDLQLHMIDSRDNSRVRYERVNEETGEEVPWDSVVRGFEYSDGNYVILSDEELKRAAPEVTKTIEIQSFVKQDEIDPIFFDTPYYLEAGKAGEKGYVLLRGAMKDSGRVGIAQVVIRTRQYLSALSARGDVLMLDLLRYPQEIRSTKELNVPSGPSKSHGVSAQELKIARTLIDAMAADWKPAEFHDIVEGKRGVDEIAGRRRQGDILQVGALIADRRIVRFPARPLQHVFRHVDAEHIGCALPARPAAEPAETAAEVDDAPALQRRQQGTQRSPFGRAVQPLHRARQAAIALEEFRIVVNVLRHGLVFPWKSPGGTTTDRATSLPGYDERSRPTILNGTPDRIT